MCSTRARLRPAPRNYLHDHGISTDTLAKVTAKNFRHGALHPNVFRHKPISEEDIVAATILTT
jgi:acetyl-CoA C-acetyltransferase